MFESPALNISASIETMETSTAPNMFSSGTVLGENYESIRNKLNLHFLSDTYNIERPLVPPHNPMIREMTEYSHFAANITDIREPYNKYPHWAFFGVPPPMIPQPNDFAYEQNNLDEPFSTSSASTSPIIDVCSSSDDENDLNDPKALNVDATSPSPIIDVCNISNDDNTFYSEYPMNVAPNPMFAAPNPMLVASNPMFVDYPQPTAPSFPTQKEMSTMVYQTPINKIHFNSSWDIYNLEPQDRDKTTNELAANEYAALTDIISIFKTKVNLDDDPSQDTTEEPKERVDIHPVSPPAPQPANPVQFDTVERQRLLEFFTAAKLEEGRRVTGANPRRGALRIPNNPVRKMLTFDDDDED